MNNLLQKIKEFLYGHEETLEEKQAKCEHMFKNYRFAKGGGRIAVCSKCGYVKHFPLKSN